MNPLSWQNQFELFVIVQNYCLDFKIRNPFSKHTATFLPLHCYFSANKITERVFNRSLW